MTFFVACILLNCVVVGAGLTYLSGIDMRLEERVAYGAVIGPIIYTIVAFITTAGGGWTSGPVLAAMFYSLVISLVGWWRGRHLFVDDCRRFGREWRSLWPLGTILLPAWFFAIRILTFAYRALPDGGMNSGHLATYSDWQAHLGYTASFAYAENSGLDLLTATGWRLTYHVGLNFFASTLVPAGATLFQALTISTGYFAFAIPAVFYLAGRRIFERRSIAALGTVLFLLFGGLGWTRWFGQSPAERAATTYTRDPDNGWWIENPIVGHLFPQRPTLIGFPIVIFVSALLWTAHKNKNWRPYAFCGAIVGLMPWFNLFGFGIPLAMAGAWFLMELTAERGNQGDYRSVVRRWGSFFGPALLLAVPMLIFMTPPESFADWTYWWAPEQINAGDLATGRTPTFAATPDKPISFWAIFAPATLWFWFKNFGVFLLLFALAQFAGLPRRLAWATLPAWAWFVIPNFVKPHPWAGNNTHYFIFIVLFGAFPVAALLVGWAERSTSRTRPLVIGALSILFASMTISGTLDVLAASDPAIGEVPLMSGADVAVGTWARNNTDPDDVFVTSQSHLQPITAVAGRRVLAGFSGWIYDLGIPDWHTPRTTDSELILQAADGFEELLELHGVDYVVIGPTERNMSPPPDETKWAEYGTLVYESGAYKVFEVNA